MLALEDKDIIAAAAIVVSATIAIGGWMIAAQKDRNSHLFQKRVEKRMGMLEDVVQAVLPLMNNPSPFEADPGLPEKLAKARLSVQLYGYDDEQAKYEAVIAAIERGDVKLTLESLKNLVPDIRQKIREEMGYKS